MHEKMLAYFNNIIPLSPEESTAIAKTMCIKEFKKGTILLRDGDVSNDTYFVLEGCVRQYSIPELDEVTTHFFTENQWVVSVQNMATNTPVSHYLECSVDSKLVVGNSELAADLFKNHPTLETIARMIMEQVFKDLHESLTEQQLLSPEQKYLKLQKTRPHLFQVIPQYQIASFIGVKPESLSRIRKRLSVQTQ
jgi:CRP-like cAMP-binding protein